MLSLFTLEYGINLAVAIIVLAYATVQLIHQLHQERDSMSKVFDFIHAAETVAPLVLSLVPGVPPALVPFIAQGLQTAEQAQGATGAQKLAIAVQETNNGIAALNAVRPGSIDATAVNAAVVNGINATVATINAIKSTHQPAPPATPAK